MNKRLLILAGAGMVATLTVPMAMHIHSRHQRSLRGQLIDKAHRERIVKGMRHDQVESILGGPAGDYTTKRMWFLSPNSGLTFRGHARETWTGDKGQIEIDFDEHNSVFLVWFEDGTDLPQAPLLEQLRALLFSR